MANISVREALGLFLVTVKETGSVDVAATQSKFAAVLSHYNASQEANDVLIRESLHSLFDQYKGTHINAAGIASMVITKMAAAQSELGQPSLYPSLAKRVSEVLHQDLGTKAEGKTWGMKKGLGGGFCRNADQPDEVVKPVKGAATQG